ncbi:MAG: ABC transporter permease [Deltaproteobacteria bacterium]
MKAIVVARKTLREMLRDPKTLLLVLLLPVVFEGLFALMGSAPRQPTYPIAVATNGAGGERLVRAIEAARYRDGRRVFETHRLTDPSTIDADLRKGTVVALLTASGDETAPPRTTIRGDAVNVRFIAASTLLGGWVDRHVAEVMGEPERVRTVPQALVDPGPATDFDLYLPGCIVFGILITIAQTATVLGQERRTGTLQRLALTRASTTTVLSGVALAQMAVCAAQVALIFAMARVLGFHNRGSIGTGMLVVFVLGFSAIGLGLVVAAFVRNDSQASNVGGVVAMVQVFLSGAFFPMPSQTLFTAWHHEVGAYDVFPATHCFAALQQVLCFGSDLRQVAFRLGAAVVLSLGYFAAGVAVFRRMQFGRGAAG